MVLHIVYIYGNFKNQSEINGKKGELLQIKGLENNFCIWLNECNEFYMAKTDLWTVQLGLSLPERMWRQFIVNHYSSDTLSDIILTNYQITSYPLRLTGALVFNSPFLIDFHGLFWNYLYIAWGIINVVIIYRVLRLDISLVKKCRPLSSVNFNTTLSHFLYLSCYCRMHKSNLTDLLKMSTCIFAPVLLNLNIVITFIINSMHV